METKICISTVQVNKVNIYFLYFNQLKRVQWPQALRIKSPQASDHTEPPFRKCHDAHRQDNTTLQRKFWRREQVPTYPLQALCSVQYAIYNVQCAICNLCNMQCAIWNMQYAICNMRYAIAMYKVSTQESESHTYAALPHSACMCGRTVGPFKRPPISIPPSLQTPPFPPHPFHPLVYSPPSIPLPPSTNPLPPPYPSHPLSVALSQHSLTKLPDTLKQLPLLFTAHAIQ